MVREEEQAQPGLIPLVLLVVSNCCRPAVVPAVVSAGVVLESAAVARPRRPGICQPESGVPTPEGSADVPIE